MYFTTEYRTRPLQSVIYSVKLLESTDERLHSMNEHFLQRCELQLYEITLMFGLAKELRDFTIILNKVPPFSEARKQECPTYGLWAKTSPPQIPIQPVR